MSEGVGASARRKGERRDERARVRRMRADATIWWILRGSPVSTRPSADQYTSAHTPRHTRGTRMSRIVRTVTRVTLRERVNVHERLCTRPSGPGRVQQRGNFTRNTGTRGGATYARGTFPRIYVALSPSNLRVFVLAVVIPRLINRFGDFFTLVRSYVVDRTFLRHEATTIEHVLKRDETVKLDSSCLSFVWRNEAQTDSFRCWCCWWTMRGDSRGERFVRTILSAAAERICFLSISLPSSLLCSLVKIVWLIEGERTLGDYGVFDPFLFSRQLFEDLDFNSCSSYLATRFFGSELVEILASWCRLFFFHCWGFDTDGQVDAGWHCWFDKKLRVPLRVSYLASLISRRCSDFSRLSAISFARPRFFSAAWCGGRNEPGFPRCYRIFSRVLGSRFTTERWRTLSRRKEPLGYLTCTWRAIVSETRRTCTLVWKDAFLTFSVVPFVENDSTR